MESENAVNQSRVLPDDLTDGFAKLGLAGGDRIVMHAALSEIGNVEGGAAMVIHRLLRVLGKKGTLLMPAFTSITRHSNTHEDFTKVGCWCGGKENRHLPFIPELQPDREFGEVAHRLCSWPASRRSRHPAFSFVAVGSHSDQLVRNYSLSDPLHPLTVFMKEDPLVLTIGTGLDSVVAIQIAEKRSHPAKFGKERALCMSATGPAWVETVALGCGKGFQRLSGHISPMGVKQTKIGAAVASLYSMKELIAVAEELVGRDPMALNCERPTCLSCQLGPTLKDEGAW